MMDYRLEVITLPVSDVDAAVRFYTERAGFTLNTWVVQERGFTSAASTSARRS